MFNFCFSSIINNILKNNPNIILILVNNSYISYINKEYVLSNIETNYLKNVLCYHIANQHEFYDFYNSIDLVLMTTPYGGCTTLFDALFMGVPAISYKGKTICDRYGYSFLNMLGVPELCVETHENYVEKVTELCNNKDLLTYYHKLILKNINEHPMTKPEIFVKSFENCIENIFDL